jgi:hypothetical protein
VASAVVTPAPGEAPAARGSAERGSIRRYRHEIPARVFRCPKYPKCPCVECAKSFSATAAAARPRLGARLASRLSANVLVSHITARGHSGTASQNVSVMYHLVIPANLVPNMREITAMRVRDSPSGRYSGPPWLSIPGSEQKSYPSSKPTFIDLCTFLSICALAVAN